VTIGAVPHRERLACAQLGHGIDAVVGQTLGERSADA